MSGFDPQSPGPGPGEKTMEKFEVVTNALDPQSIAECYNDPEIKKINLKKIFGKHNTPGNFDEL